VGKQHKGFFAKLFGLFLSARIAHLPAARVVRWMPSQHRTDSASRSAPHLRLCPHGRTHRRAHGSQHGTSNHLDRFHGSLSRSAQRLTIALISHRFEAVAARAAHCMVIAAWQPRMLRGLGACLGVFVSVVAGAGPRAVLTPVQERVVSFTSHSLHTMHDHAHHSLTLTRVIWPSCVAQVTATEVTEATEACAPLAHTHSCDLAKLRCSSDCN
jgi:hypothetical protein